MVSTESILSETFKHQVICWLSAREFYIYTICVRRLEKYYLRKRSACIEKVGCVVNIKIHYWVTCYLFNSKTLKRKDTYVHWPKLTYAICCWTFCWIWNWFCYIFLSIYKIYIFSIKSIHRLVKITEWLVPLLYRFLWGAFLPILQQLVGGVRAFWVQLFLHDCAILGCFHEFLVLFPGRVGIIIKSAIELSAGNETLWREWSWLF